MPNNLSVKALREGKYRLGRKMSVTNFWCGWRGRGVEKRSRREPNLGRPAVGCLDTHHSALCIDLH